MVEVHNFSYGLLNPGLAYLAVKRSEVAAFDGADPAYECFEHFTKI